MAHSKKPVRRKKGAAKQNFMLLPIGGSKHNLALPAMIVGALVLLATAAVLLTQRSDTSAKTRTFDPNFEPEVEGAPRIAVPEDTVDHGDVQLGTTITSEFKLRNVGDQPLVILSEPLVEVVEGC